MRVVRIELALQLPDDVAEEINDNIDTFSADSVARNTIHDHLDTTGALSWATITVEDPT